VKRPLWGGIAALGLAAGLVGGPAPLGAGVASAEPIVDLTFLNINDFHGRINADTIRFAATVQREREAAVAAGADVAFLSAGDNIGASLFASSVQDDQPTIDLLNELELEASAVGNHEFDRGIDDLRDRVIDAQTNAGWDYLAANVYESDGVTPIFGEGEGSEYSLITMGTAPNEVQVAVIGVVTDETPQLVRAGGIEGLVFGDPIEAVERVSAELSDGVPGNGEADVIIAEYHEGAGAGIPEGSTLEQEVAEGGDFARIVNETPAEVDVIFTGHTHKRYAWDGPVPGDPGRTRPIVQTGSYGEFIGKVTLSVDLAGDGAEVVDYTAENVARIPFPAGVDTPAEIAAFNAELVAEYDLQVVETIVSEALAFADEVGSEVVGEITRDITRARTGGTYVGGVYTGGTQLDDRSQESTLGNVVADMLLETLADPAAGGADFGVVNPGGLRADLLFESEGEEADGEVTLAEAVAVLPFANSLFTVTLTGAQVDTMLEQQWQRLPNGQVPSRPYLQLGLSDNVTYTFDATRAEGDRVTSIAIDGDPIDPAGQYRVGSFSFLLEGGDNFRVFREGTDLRDSGLIDSDAWIDHLRRNSSITPGGTALTPDDARQGVEVRPTPTAVTIGGRIDVDVSNLDIPSSGARANTTLAVSVGGVSLGEVPVTNGTASVDLAVPKLPLGPAELVMVAQPTGTTVTIPVLVTEAFVPVTPSRVFDTRGPTESPNALRTVPVAKVGGDNVLKVRFTDLPGGLTPATGVGAVTLNVAVTGASGPGYVTVYPCGQRRLVASINYTAGESVSNSVIAPVSAQGEVCFYSLVPVDIVVDISGWLPATSDFRAVEPSRLFDTRGAAESPDALRAVPASKLVPGARLQVKVTDIPGLIPAAGVAAVSVNVAVTNSDQPGWVRAYPCDDTPPFVATVNYAAGQTVSNGAIVPVAADGTICFTSLRATDLVVDVNGWFATGGGYNAVRPARAFDTRGPAESPNAIRTVPVAKVGPGAPLEVRLTDLGGLVPATGVGAVSMNIAVDDPDAAGFVTAYPCGTRPFVANVNYAADETVSNGAIVPVSATGTVCFYSLQPTHLIVDVNGWFSRPV